MKFGSSRQNISGAMTQNPRAANISAVFLIQPVTPKISCSMTMPGTPEAGASSGTASGRTIQAVNWPPSSAVRVICCPDMGLSFLKGLVGAVTVRVAIRVTQVCGGGSTSAIRI